MTAGLDNLKHIVVLMMENRSFDHMLGGLKKQYPKINGLTGNESNPDTTGQMVQVKLSAKFAGELKDDPNHHFPGVDLQIFGGSQANGRVANMQGFVKSYFTQTSDVDRSHAIMNYFPPDQVPVLTTLATEFAVFNGWFSSIPGPTICNRAFAHYGTSFGQVSMDIFYLLDPIWSIYERMVQAGHTAKIYYYDQQSSTMEIVNLLKNQPSFSELSLNLSRTATQDSCRNTVSSNPVTTTTRVPMGEKFWRRTSIPITMFARARGLSPPSITSYGQTHTSGRVPRCWLCMTNMVTSMTT